MPRRRKPTRRPPPTSPPAPPPPTPPPARFREASNALSGELGTMATAVGQRTLGLEAATQGHVDQLAATCEHAVERFATAVASLSDNIKTAVENANRQGVAVEQAALAQAQ